MWYIKYYIIYSIIYYIIYYIRYWLHGWVPIGWVVQRLKGQSFVGSHSGQHDVNKLGLCVSDLPTGFEFIWFGWSWQGWNFLDPKKRKDQKKKRNKTWLAGIEFYICYKLTNLIQIPHYCLKLILLVRLINNFGETSHLVPKPNFERITNIPLKILRREPNKTLFHMKETIWWLIFKALCMLSKRRRKEK